MMQFGLKNRVILPGLQVMAGGGVDLWTPLLPTTDGGVSAHTIMSPALGITPFYQDSGKTTPVAADGDPIGAMDNPGTDAYDVTQGTPSAKCTYKTNILDGKAVARFDGGDFLTGTFSGGNLTQPLSVIAVAKLDASALGTTAAIADGNDTTNRVSLRQFGANWNVYAGNSVNFGASDAVWNIWTVIVNGASSKIWINGNGGSTVNLGANILDGLTIGARFDGALNFWVGDIASYFLLPGNISNADKNQYGNWLKDTYPSLSYTDIT